MRLAGLMLALSLAVGACTEGEGERTPLWGDQPAEPLDLRGELSANEAPLLGEIELRLDLFVGDGVDVKFAPSVPPGFTGDVEEAPSRPVAGGEWVPFTLSLRPTELGDVTIPPFEARAGDDGPVATSPEWTIVVSSVLGEAGAGVEAPAPLFPTKLVLWPWFVGAGALVLLVVLFLLWRRFRPARAEPLETSVPPHVKALRALARLRDAPRTTAEQVEVFYVDVSLVLRIYLGERFGLHAPERTTEEFLAEVEADARLAPELRGGLSEFLAQCDLVKFARVHPGEGVHARTFDTAEQFIETTREDRVREGAA